MKLMLDTNICIAIIKNKPKDINNFEKENNTKTISTYCGFTGNLISEHTIEK